MNNTELLKNYFDMCETLRCDDCPLNKGQHSNCHEFVRTYPEEAVAIIDEWAEKQNRKTGWERVRKGWCYVKDGKIHPENGSEKCDKDYNEANYFDSSKLAKNIDKFQTICRRIFRWIAENDPNPITKEDRCNLRRGLYYVFYDCHENTLSVCNTYGSTNALFYLSNINTAEKLIKTFKEELTWLFTEFEFFDRGETNE